MGNEGHTCRNRGIFTVGGGNNYRIKAEWHCRSAYGTKLNAVRQVNKIKHRYSRQRHKNQPYKRDYVNRDIGKGRFEIYFSDCHTRKQHCHGRHTVAKRSDNSSNLSAFAYLTDKLGKTYIRKA